MKAEIISIGNEVVDGSVINTNSSWLAGQLSQLGISVCFHTAVPDDEALMLDAFSRAQQRVQLVLVTGGLGPTVDDFTLEVAAKFFKKPLKQDSTSLKKIHTFFEKLGRQATSNQEKQALMPEGASVLENSVGTAPGAYYLSKEVHFAFFPGVPQEMKSMFREQFLPILKKDPKRGAERHLKVLRCFGIPEGQMDHELRKKIQGRVGLLETELGFRVRFPYIDIRLYCSEKDFTKAQDKLNSAAQIIREHLGNYIISENDEFLPKIIGDLLTQKKQTVSCAESCTGGLIANLITDIAGASTYFIEGVVTYSNQAKIDLLGVSPQILEKHGAVSEETALAMAMGIRKIAKTDFAIATTGIAGPDGGTTEKPVGTVYIAFADQQKEWVKKFHFPFGRDRFKQVVAATALDRLRRQLLNLSH
ncbi:MAG: competence/damage-inducible protein A [Deltaproteobacteria bacterium]|nr:competence/damage-inducible protein A [Deltaproteobacteria bacterium]